ncbi:MAG TPA: hypothetical protein VLZ54_10905 [Arenibacter sp.]|nr:hypothetical protein [Arenibacter sp.]
MILDSTTFHGQHKQIINDLVGRSFGFFDLIRLRGTESKRMAIQDMSPNFLLHLGRSPDANYIHIEIRPSGVLIFINKGRENLIWVIPYYQLVIYTTNGITIRAHGNYIHLGDDALLPENNAFFRKLSEVGLDYGKECHFAGRI